MLLRASRISERISQAPEPEEYEGLNKEAFAAKMIGSALGTVARKAPGFLWKHKKPLGLVGAVGGLTGLGVYHGVQQAREGLTPQALVANRQRYAPPPPRPQQWGMARGYHSAGSGGRWEPFM